MELLFSEVNKNKLDGLPSLVWLLPSYLLLHALVFLGWKSKFAISDHNTHKTVIYSQFQTRKNITFKSVTNMDKNK